MAVQTLTHLAGVKSQRLVSAMATLLLGCALVLAVGFAPVETLHNATHDTRHAAAFPCH